MKSLLSKSYHDYKISVRLFLDYERKEDDDYSIALYLMQQSIEKCLKVYLRYKGVSYPKTHDVRTLRMLAEYNGLPNYQAIITYETEINLWEAATRYIFYELENKDVYYAVLCDYCSMYAYVSKLIN